MSLHWDEVAAMVKSVRGHHEQLLTLSKISSTTGTCLYASFILQLTLKKFGGCDVIVRGGDGAGDGGAMDSSGSMRGHYWVEGATSQGDAFVADITADQFGFSAVFFDTVDRARSRYVPGDDEVVQYAVRELELEARSTIAAK